jgi:thiol-disulfide isomerase/thioredoxin
VKNPLILPEITNLATVKISSLLILFTIFFNLNTYSQTFSLEISIKNQPDNYIVFGSIRGDDYHPIDTILLHPDHTKNVKKAEYSIPENLETGMYRLILGKTTYARVMNEPPQQVDFIYNNENLIFETDFEEPEEKLLVVLSEENRIWNEFVNREKIFQDQLNEMELEIEFYRKKDNSDKLPHSINRYNELQMQRESFIHEMITRYSDFYASKLMQMYREPYLDGNLSIKERKETFQNEYFKLLNFNDESLMNSSVYTDKIFYYLTSYNKSGFNKEQLEKEYIKAVGIVLSNTSQNQKIYEFILDYMVHGFEVLKMENVLDHIANNYSGTTCQTDEKTTLERKLESQKMKIGTLVPDFTLTDSEGFFVNFSDIMQEKTLLLFWASWCPHCNDIIPHVKTWTAGQENMKVVAISLDTSKVEWQSAVSSLGIENWTNLSDLKKWDGKVTEEYNVYATPTMIIIDKERKILAKPITLQDLISLDLK